MWRHTLNRILLILYAVNRTHESVHYSTYFRELLVAGAGLPAGAGGRVLRGLAEARLHHALQRGLRRGLQGLHHLARVRPRNHQAETREQALLFSILSFRDWIGIQLNSK